MTEQTDQEPTQVVLEEAEYSPPSDEYLTEQILTFLKENRPEVLRSTSSPPPFADRTAWTRLSRRGSGRELPEARRIQAHRGRSLPLTRPVCTPYAASFIRRPPCRRKTQPYRRADHHPRFSALELVGWRARQGQPCRHPPQRAARISAVS